MINKVPKAETSGASLYNVTADPILFCLMYAILNKAISSGLSRLDLVFHFKARAECLFVSQNDQRLGRERLKNFSPSMQIHPYA